MSDYVKDKNGNLIPSKENLAMIAYHFWKDLLPPPSKDGKIYTCSKADMVNLSKRCAQYKDHLITIVSYLKTEPRDIAFAYAINLPMDTHYIVSDIQMHNDYMVDYRSDTYKGSYDEYKYLFIVGDGFNDSNPLRAEVLLKLIMQRKVNKLYTIIIFRRVPGEIGGRPKALRSLDTNTNLLDLIGKECLCLLDSDKDISIMQNMGKQASESGGNL